MSEYKLFAVAVVIHQIGSGYGPLPMVCAAHSKEEAEGMALEATREKYGDLEMSASALEVSQDMLRLVSQ